jgi:hypothetical protein
MIKVWVRNKVFKIVDYYVLLRRLGLCRAVHIDQRLAARSATWLRHARLRQEISMHYTQKCGDEVRSSEPAEAGLMSVG